MNSEKLIEEIKNGKTKILAPIFDGLAYIDLEITDKENCLINLGDNYYVKTKIGKATEIAKRINLEKAKNDCSIRKLDENTIEIRENIVNHEEEEKKKKEEKEKDNEEKEKDNEEKIKEQIREENKRLLEKIEQLNKKNQNKNRRLKLKKKEEIIDIVLKKLKV